MKERMYIWPYICILTSSKSHLSEAVSRSGGGASVLVRVDAAAAAATDLGRDDVDNFAPGEAGQRPPVGGLDGKDLLIDLDVRQVGKHLLNLPNQPAEDVGNSLAGRVGWSSTQ